MRIIKVIAMRTCMAIMVLAMLTACAQPPAGSVPYAQNSVSSVSPSQISQPEDRSFSKYEEDAMLQNMMTTYNYIDIFDYAFGDKDSIVYAAAICRDMGTGNETLLVFTTSTGVGCVVLADGMLEVKYDREGFWIDGGDIIKFALHNEETNETHDYHVEFYQDGNDIMFEVKADLRNRLTGK